MACRYTVDGKTYNESEFKDYLRAMPVSEAAKFIPGLRSIPDMPMAKDWPALSMKRMIRYAAEHGYEQIAWTPGKVQADRYNLAKHVKEIEYIKRGYVTENGKQVDTYELGVIDHSGNGIDLPNKGRMTLDQIEETLGKEMAEKIANGEGRKFRGHEGYTLSGLDLQVGGEGMRAFYDRELVNTANKLGKKFGAKVGRAGFGDLETGQYRVTLRDGSSFVTDLNGTNRAIERDNAGTTIEPVRAATQVHTLPVTSQLREAVLKEGFPLFQRGAEGQPQGRITLADNKAIVELFKTADQSTFMHEMGHKWLDELVTDAAREKVPQALKDDLGTVLRWLGVDKAEDIGIAQHEQWARGFEQYLMEGKAPSTGLAKAFESFKRWLTEIYRSLTQLGTPITNDIRAVMDRMLATDAELAKRVIADLPQQARADAMRETVTALIEGRKPMAGELIEAGAKVDPRIAESVALGGRHDEVVPAGDKGAAAGPAFRDLAESARRGLDDPEVVAASKVADTTPEPPVFKPTSERLQALAKAAAETDEQFKFEAEALPADLREKFETAVSRLELDSADRTEAYKRGAACLLGAV